MPWKPCMVKDLVLAIWGVRYLNTSGSPDKSGFVAVSMDADLAVQGMRVRGRDHGWT